MLLCSEAAKLQFNAGDFEEGRDENEMGVIKLEDTFLKNVIRSGAPVAHAVMEI